MVCMNSLSQIADIADGTSTILSSQKHLRSLRPVRAARQRSAGSLLKMQVIKAKRPKAPNNAGGNALENNRYMQMYTSTLQLLLLSTVCRFAQLALHLLGANGRALAVLDLVEFEDCLPCEARGIHWVCARNHQQWLLQ